MALKLTQQQLAEMINRSTVYVSLIESGNRCPSLDTLLNITRCLSTSMDAIIGDKATRDGAPYVDEIEFLLAERSTGEKALVVDTMREMLMHISNGEVVDLSPPIQGDNRQRQGAKHPSRPSRGHRQSAQPSAARAAPELPAHAVVPFASAGRAEPVPPFQEPEKNKYESPPPNAPSEGQGESPKPYEKAGAPGHAPGGGKSAKSRPPAKSAEKKESGTGSTNSSGSAKPREPTKGAKPDEGGGGE
jgi:transcriptional regulator with XRE-family HTH domain